ncbi:ADP-ribose pyrophosphatase YjhB (NUDIX family) [Anseongella ginsenosidimutans]|uniref:ADP-ribose pyrophosphatase YjhB (NUDIX family) n=1 Tax=Anseongella ginsenosidimutans TaxID=496056 RepID=A0A4R3KJS0_9SPHI|nr:NUDIX domain-containing protein [Anseongella ginsenosidimutans]QEC53765.1 NUDIX domain-containing protein [Anseongella ginsenosidimutans]TCS83645.1 ADP-ribose pyrophosphatase YjhB (NUDIX family) [Anseongella ginsenosidimutans]
MKPRPSLLVIEEDCLLLMRYNYNGRRVYGIPGGNPDEGESLQDALIRELREELQVAVQPGDMIFSAETVRPGKPDAHVLHCLFEGKILEGRPALDPAETTAAAIEWIPVRELETLHLYPHLGKAIAQWHREQLPHKTYLGAILQPWA